MCLWHTQNTKNDQSLLVNFVWSVNIKRNTHNKMIVDHLNGTEKLTPAEWKVLLCSPINAKQCSGEIFWTRGCGLYASGWTTFLALNAFEINIWKFMHAEQPCLLLGCMFLKLEYSMLNKLKWVYFEFMLTEAPCIDAWPPRAHVSSILGSGLISLD